MIIIHPCTDQFDQEHHAPYIEFVHDLLPQTRDAMVLHKQVRGEVRDEPGVHRDVPHGARLPPGPPVLHVVLGRGGAAAPRARHRRRRRQRLHPEAPRLGDGAHHRRGARDGEGHRAAIARDHAAPHAADRDGGRDGREREASGSCDAESQRDAERLDVARRTARRGASRRRLVLGGTGFLGKVFWSMLLDRYPDVGRIYLVVRPKSGGTPEERFWSDIATSEALEPLRRAHGDGYEAFLREKVVPIDGDIGAPALRPRRRARPRARRDDRRGRQRRRRGRLQPAARRGARRERASARRTSSRCARALGDDARGHLPHEHLLRRRARARARSTRTIRATHPVPARATSSARDLVGPRARDRRVPRPRRAGAAPRRGRVPPERVRRDARARTSPRAASPSTAPRSTRELARVKRKFVERARSSRRASSARPTGAGRTSTRTRRASASRSSRGAACRSPSCARRAASRRVEFPFARLERGHQHVGAAHLPHHEGAGADPRAATCRSISSRPTTSCAGMILALAELLEGTAKPVYQFGATDVNPCTAARFGELTGLYKRKYYQRKGDGNPLVDFAARRASSRSFVDRAALRARRARRRSRARRASVARRSCEAVARARARGDGARERGDARARRSPRS